MIENQSIFKKGKMDHQPDPDLLSDLPLGIIHFILGCVPIRDAVRTSVLSRQWRYTWASLPQLVFEEYSPSPNYDERMKNFITNALLHHKGPIHKFKMSVLFESSCPDVNEWILCLSRNEIKELILHMGSLGFHKVPEVHSSIYSCEKLTNLKLSYCELDPPPSTFKGFLFLRCLVLREIFMSCKEIESLVANSPLLERFELLEIESIRSELRISAPNLKYLGICGDYIELCVSAPLLAEMSIELCDDYFIDEHQQQKSSVCNYTNFMGGFTNLEKLSGSEYFTKYLSMGIESCHHTLVFHQLKDLELKEVDVGDIKTISVVAHLIVGSPNLQKLKIQTYYSTEGGDESEVQHVSFSDFGCAPNFKLEKLRVVKMDGLSGFAPEVELINFLLERSPVLETMNLGYFCTSEKQNVTAKLLGFSWASPNVKLSF